MVGCCGDEMFGCSLVGGYGGIRLNLMNHLGYRHMWWLRMVGGGGKGLVPGFEFGYVA